MKETENIRKRYTELLRMGNISEDAMRAYKKCPPSETLLRNMVKGEVEGTYRWADIEYDNLDKAEWRASAHYVRTLAILIENPESRLFDEKDFREKMVGALKYWLHYDFQNPNWWHREIGVPKNIGDITLLLYNVLDKETVEKALTLIKRGSFKERPEISEKWTGANLIWGGVNTIKHALLTDDEPLLALAINRIAEEIKYDREGIQKDGSFFQHGRRLYSGGYGRAFAYDISQLAFLMQGTKYQFAKEKLDIFLKHILDGVRYMTRGDALDVSAINRELAREDAIKTGLLKSSVEMMLKTDDMPRKDEIKAYLTAINGGKQLEATKLFKDAMLLCHHFDGIYVGAKFTSDTLWDQDTCNGEGELCLNMTYGTHLNVMVDGSEYLNIYPLWDFSKVPGTTALNESDESLQAKFDKHNWCCDPLPNSHYGCQQVGDKAVIFEKAEHEGVIAYVTDFAFKGGFVSLGAGIENGNGALTSLTTTVDQCFRQGEIIRENKSLIHHGVRYTELGETKIEANIINAEGDWNRVNRYRLSHKVKGELVLLTISHSERVKDYAYMISSAEKQLPQVEVIRNDSEVQAIKTADGKIMAVFHKDSSFTCEGAEIRGKEKEIVIQ
ncbi:MAG: hypothetical protein J6M16_03355 [Clostridia bacterium]|nr:hypothetical protein [Clostridia bacterium]